MPNISFERLVRVEPGDTTSLGAGQLPVIDLLTPSADRTHIYDPLWGYFTVAEETAWTYSDARVGQSTAAYTISTTWTRGAEVALGNLAHDSTDAEAFDVLTGRMMTLQAVLNEAAQAAAPLNYAEWFVSDAADARVVRLPDPLRDRHGNPLYALPSAFEVSQSRFGEAITCRTSLLEARAPALKLAINGMAIDSGTLTIRPPAPILSRMSPTHAHGEAVFVKGYTRTRVDINGTVGSKDPFAMIAAAPNAMVQDLVAGDAEVGLYARDASGAASLRILFPHIAITQPQVSMDVAAGTVSITLAGHQ
jgi:hypothetical protein